MRAIAEERRVAVGRPGRGARVKGFFRDAWLELQKVIWPTREEVTKMTGLVVAVVLVVGLFIFFWDKILVEITRPLFPQ
jgi:preprotein translocase subunit SecE